MANYHHFSAGGGSNVREKEGQNERGSKRKTEREGERLREPTADEVEAAEISQEIKPYFHSMEIRQHPP